MQHLFSEITALCRDEQFLHSVMKKYHYDPEEYPNLQQIAEQMVPCLETEAGWQDRDLEETFPEGERSFLAVGITLGNGIDELQENYLRDGLLTESYMIEVLSSELLLKSYQAYTEWVAAHSKLHVARLHFLGTEIPENDTPGSKTMETDTLDPKLSSRLQLENLPTLLRELQLPVACNEAYCMIPKKSVVFYAELTKDAFTKCAGICLGCGRRDCPNRMEEKENFPLRFADMTDRPLSYGYAKIFSRP